MYDIKFLESKYTVCHKETCIIIGSFFSKLQMECRLKCINYKVKVINFENFSAKLSPNMT